LKPIERERFAGPDIVATEAFCAPDKTPGDFTSSTRRGRVGNSERFVGALSRDEFSIRLLFVPTIGVGIPRLALEVQELRFDTPERGWLAALHFQRERPRQDGVRREAITMRPAMVRVRQM
jgi:hypothetical protein